MMVGAECAWLLSSRSERPPGEANDGKTRRAAFLMAGTAGTEVGARNELAPPPQEERDPGEGARRDSATREVREFTFVNQRKEPGFYSNFTKKPCSK